jgi:hypothetical protein
MVGGQPPRRESGCGSPKGRRIARRLRGASNQCRGRPIRRRVERERAELEAAKFAQYVPLSHHSIDEPAAIGAQATQRPILHSLERSI